MKNTKKNFKVGLCIFLLSSINTIIIGADVAVTKVVTDPIYPPFVAGEDGEYTIVVTNNGPVIATNVTVDDIFPEEFVYVSWTAVGGTGGYGFPTYFNTSGTGDISEVIGSMPVDSFVTYTVLGTIDPSATGTITNTVSVGEAGDLYTANDVATTVTPVVSEIDLEIVKTALENPFVGGFSGSLHTIVVSNNGPSDVTDVTVIDNFPSVILTPTWTALGSATPPTGTFTAAGAGDINEVIGSLPSGETVTYTVSGTVSADAIGTVSNTATVFPPDGAIETDLTNNTSTLEVPVQTKFKVAGEVSIFCLCPETSTLYTLTVENTSSSVLTGLSIALSSDCGLDFSNPSPQYDYDLSYDIWTVPDVPAMGSQTLGLDITSPLTEYICDVVDCNILAEVTIENTAQVFSICTPIQIKREAELGISINAVSDSFVCIGGTIDFEIIVENKGPCEVTDIDVEIVDGSGGSLGTPTIVVEPSDGYTAVMEGSPLTTWTISSLAANATDCMTLRYTISAGGLISTTASIVSVLGSPGIPPCINTDTCAVKELTEGRCISSEVYLDVPVEGEGQVLRFQPI